MTGTDLPPDHVVAKVIPRQGKATVEKIAVNAVMAGALPTHMPVLIAAIESLADPKTRFDTFEVSTGSWAPFFAINGPIRDQIHINYGSGALSPGDQRSSLHEAKAGRTGHELHRNGNGPGHHHRAGCGQVFFGVHSVVPARRAHDGRSPLAS